MDCSQSQSQYFINIEKMSNICPRIVPAGIAIAIRVQRREILGVLGISNDHLAPCGHGSSVSGYPGGQYAVSHVYAPNYSFKQVVRSSYTHQVPWLILRQEGCRIVQNLAHCLHWFTHTQSSYSIAAKIHFQKVPCTLFPKVSVHSTLDYSKKTLGIPVLMMVLASLSPSSGPFHGLFCIFIISWIGDTFVKTHHNIRT